MILEAFSTYLKANYTDTANPEVLLHRWLMFHYRDASPDHVSRVIQTELALIRFDEESWFTGTSDHGAKLLNSLYQYCHSYDHWQFSRWLHEVQPRDFSLPKSKY